MAIVLSTGIIIPEPTDYISPGGIDEMALAFRGANDAIEARSLIGHQHTVSDITDFDDAVDLALAPIAAELARKMDVEATELPNGTDANTLTTPGVYYESRSSGAGPNFPEPTAGVFTVTANPPREHIHQQYITFGAANPRQWYRSRYNGTWSPWKQIVTQDMMVEVVDQLREDIWDPQDLADADLNTIMRAGLYTQDFSAEATEARNYPAEGTRAGRLFVQANTFGTQVTQQYITYDANEYMMWFIRNYYLDWGPWQLVSYGDGGSGGGLEPEELGSLDLDDVKDPGAYSQQFSASATEALHYPVGGDRAGRLLVQANGSRSQVSQWYITFDSTSNVRYFVRNFYSTWGPWYLIPLETGDDGTEAGLFKGLVAEGTDVNTLRAEGIYTVPSTTVAGTLLNYPTNRAGIIEVWTNEGSSMTTQEVTAMVSSTTPAEKYWRATLSLGNTSWGPWTTQEWIKGTANGSSGSRLNVDTFRTAGAWMVTNRTYVDGLPGTGYGLLENYTSGSFSLGLQRFTERVENDDVVVWQRFSLLVGGWAGIAWDQLSGGGGGEGSSRVTDVQVSDHASRVEVEASKRGGSIGTGGVPVFMWRFDHWLVAFRDLILPALRDSSLPGTLNVNYDNLDNPQNGGGSITWADVQDWNQYDGIEIANHGSTHTNASTLEAIYHEVVEGRRNLETAMPRTPVVTWQEHGSAYLVAGDLEGDIGLDLGREPKNFFESYAGRAILAEHAVVEGKFGSFYPPLTGRPQIGQSHYSMDRQTAAEAIETIQFAQKVGRGLTGYTHPGLMDQVNVGGSLYPATYNADGSVDFQGTDAAPTHYATEAEFRTAQDTAGNIVHMPVKDFVEICEWLEVERDEGRIMVMSAAGGGFADSSHGRRENLLIADSWSGSGFTISGEGETFTAVSTAAATTMSQGMLLYTRFGWAMGAGHEVLVYARADAATTITLSMEELGNPANWFSEKVHEVPGDGVLRPYRLNVTLPRDRSITQMTVRVGGPSLTIEGEPLLAAI